MKLNHFIKSIPIITTVTLIFVLYINNQKINTNLRILIWDTPTFSLGTYIAFSAGTGFLLSYLVTSKLASINSFEPNKKIKYRNIQNNETSYEVNNETSNETNNENIFSNFRNTREKTLIERNVNDPSPTINAEFRVIGKTQKYKSKYNSNSLDYNENEYDKSYINEDLKNEDVKKVNEYSNDWNDDSFSSW